MFSFLQKYLPKTNPALGSSSPQTEPGRMTLEERKEFRREMLYHAIRESLLQLQVISNTYKFKVMNLDERHHRFIAMIEVSNRFAAKRPGLSMGFNQIEALIQKHSLESFGVTLEAIFWRVNESQEFFARTSRAGDSARAMRHDKKTAGPSDSASSVSGAGRRLSRGPVNQGLDGAGGTRDIQVDHLDYESDHAPLQSETREGGTQYGPL